MQFEQKENVIYLKGNLIYSTVTKVLKDSQPFFTSNKKDNLIINMEKVEQVDSSALSLMCEWKRLAQKNNMRLTFESVHVKLQNLMDVCNVKALLLNE